MYCHYKTSLWAKIAKWRRQIKIRLKDLPWTYSGWCRTIIALFNLSKAWKFDSSHCGTLFFAFRFFNLIYCFLLLSVNLEWLHGWEFRLTIWWTHSWWFTSYRLSNVLSFWRWFWAIEIFITWVVATVITACAALRQLIFFMPRDLLQSWLFKHFIYSI